MNYYKITLPEKTYVARGEYASIILNHFYEDFGFDEVDVERKQSFFAIEPMTEGLTVNGVAAEEALENAVDNYLASLNEEKEAYIAAVGNEFETLEEAIDVFEENFGNKKSTIIILEADSEKFDEHFLKDNKLWVSLADGREMPYEQWEKEQKIYEALLWD